MEKINVKETILNAEETIMHAEESITSFFRRNSRERETTYVGKLDGKLVGSRQPVIIYEYPHILHAADTVEDGATFLVKLSEVKAASQAAVYKYDTDRWQKLHVSSFIQNAQPS